MILLFRQFSHLKKKKNKQKLTLIANFVSQNLKKKKEKKRKTKNKSLEELREEEIEK